MLCNQSHCHRERKREIVLWESRPQSSAGGGSVTVSLVFCLRNLSEADKIRKSVDTFCFQFHSFAKSLRHSPFRDAANRERSALCRCLQPRIPLLQPHKHLRVWNSRVELWRWLRKRSTSDNWRTNDPDRNCQLRFRKLWIGPSTSDDSRDLISRLDRSQHRNQNPLDFIKQFILIFLRIDESLKH